MVKDMKKICALFTFFTLCLNSWGQSFIRTDLEQRKDQKLVKTTQVEVQEKEILLTQNLLNEESGDIVRDESSEWPVTYQKDGHIVGEHDKKNATTLTLIYSNKLLQQFTSEFEVDKYLKKAYKKAEKENKTKCPDGFANYKALALETSKNFSKVFQAICFK